MEHRTLADGGPRVKFNLIRNGAVTELFGGSFTRERFLNTALELAAALTELAKCGATPILPDGMVAGNGAALVKSGSGVETVDYLVVSKSGKKINELIDPEKDVCVVTRFDSDKWEAEYYSNSDSVVPTSDTPLHHCILAAHRQFGWSEIPSATLHGHRLDSLEDAERLKLPCSPEETLFSTPEDLSALLLLMGRFPYPANKVYVRRGHGFFILGKDIPDAVDTFRSVVLPHLIDSPICVTDKCQGD